MTPIYGSLPKRPSAKAIVKAANIHDSYGYHVTPDAMIEFVSEHFAGRKTVSKREGQEIMALLLSALFDGAFDQPDTKPLRAQPVAERYEPGEREVMRLSDLPVWMRYVAPAEETLTDRECADLLEEAVVGLTPADQRLFDERYEIFCVNVWRNDDDTVNLELFEIWIDGQFDLWHARTDGYDGPVVEAPTVEATPVEVEYTFDADDEPELIAAFLPDLHRLSMPTIRKETKRAMNLRRASYGYDRLTRRHLACLVTQGDTVALEWLESGRPSPWAPMAAA